jgi:alanine dehydrogenase
LGRSNAEEITLFKSVGVAIEDLALALEVYERARKRGIGKEIAL